MNAYHEKVSYDANGNINSYLRNGALSQINIDNLEYNYLLNVDGTKSNKLGFVTDLQTIATNYPLTNDPIEDIDHQIAGYNSDQTSANYSYDPSGNLISDVAEGINEISWNLAGKISRIEKSDGTILSYFYDAMGNRIGKSNFDGTNTNSTWYIRDASGNNMATYNRYNDQGLYIDEFNIYGSSSLGTFKPPWHYPVTSQSTSSANSTYFAYPSVYKQYELTNHLGNVLSTISDQKTPINNDSDPETDYFTAIVKTQQDYYPFGMMMPARTYSLGGDYRYGFNGKERSDEISGKGNHNTALFWEYDTRLGRRWNLDPKPVAMFSDYSTLSNNPLNNVDILGDTVVVNLFNKANAPFYDAAENMVLNKKNYSDGIFIIAGHGDPTHTEDNRGDFPKDLEPKDLMELLKANPEYKNANEQGIQPIIVVASCNTAKDPDTHFGTSDAPKASFAQILSAIAGKDKFVIAPYGYVMNSTSKTAQQNEKSIVRKNHGGVVGLDTDGKGVDNIPKWNIFEDGKNASPNRLIK